MQALLFVLLCALYLLLIPSPPSLPAAIVKILPILMLVYRAVSRAGKRERIPLGLGLIFSCIGDLILALSPEARFVLGVGAFLTAHICYIATFARRVRYSTRSMALAACVTLWCGGVAAIVVPQLGTFLVPVVAYMIVIAAMGVSAAFATGPDLVLFTGAFAFIVSDSAIAVDRFVGHFNLASYLVMITYYFGQFCIVHGIVGRDERQGLAVQQPR